MGNRNDLVPIWILAIYLLLIYETVDYSPSIVYESAD